MNNDYVKLQDEHKKLTEEGFKSNRPITSTSGYKKSAKKKKLTTQGSVKVLPRPPTNSSFVTGSGMKTTKHAAERPSLL